MEPQGQPVPGPEVSPQPGPTPETQPAQPAEQQPAPTPEKKAGSSEGAAQNAPAVLPQVQPQPTAQPTPSTPTAPAKPTGDADDVGKTPVVADDVDVIEKEWVNKTKSVVKETKTDPHKQKKGVSVLKADYMKKRYGKDVKLSDDDKAA